MTKRLWNEFLFVYLNVSVFTQLSAGEIQSIAATLPAASFPSLTDKKTTYSISNPNNDRPVCSCSSYLKMRFLLVRFMRPLPPRSCGGPATSEVVTGIPRLIRLIVSLNRRIAVAVPLFPPGSRLPLVPFAGLQQDCSSAGLPFRSCQGFSFFFLFFFSKSWLPMWGRRAKLARKWSCHSETEEVRCSVGRRS